MDDLRIVLLGKTGAGKSSLAKTVFGERVFEIYHTADSGTGHCQRATREVHGRNITVIDTPGFFDNRTSEDLLRSNITRCITECSPGPHAFLILLKVERYTDQENEIISRIREAFSEEAFRYSVVVFTHGDQLLEGMQIEEFVCQNEALHDLLKRCGGRCHVVDNRYWNNNQQDEYRNNQRQVENLLNTITEMMNQNPGGYYTNEMLEAVERRILEEAEHIKSSSPNMLWENIRIKAKDIVYNLLKNAAGITIGILLGALLGVPVMVAKVVTALKRKEALPDIVKVVAPAAAAVLPAAAVEAAGAIAGVAVAAGAAVGGAIGYHEAVKADSIEEAVSNTANAVSILAKQEFKNMFNTT